MESKRTATTYFIPPGKFLLMENALGNPDLIQSSVSSDCRVTIVDSANFPLDELEQWPTFRLTSADIKLKLGDGAYYIYIVVPTPDNTESTSAFISYNTALVDRDGYQVIESEDEEGNPKLEKGELLGKSGFKYYQCGVISARGENSSAITTPAGQGRLLSVDLGVNPQDANLDKKVDWDFFYSLFKPHYDDPKDPTKLTWIEAKSHMGIQGGVTMFIAGEGMDLPSIYDGLPIDWNTLIRDENGVLKVNPDLKLGGEGVSNFWDLSGIPSWITNSKPKYTYSEIEGTPDLSGYATESWVNTRIDSLINGAPAAYDTLNEIADVLQGNVNSIGDIITALGTKWTQDNTKIANWDTAYSWGNHANAGYALKSYVDDTFVTLGTTQTITGEKNFTGGIKVNGSPIYYDSTNKYWKLEGDLLVTGGITMYGDSVSGGSAGATTLGQLQNVGNWADSVADVDRIMYQAAGSSNWVAKSLSSIGGGVSGDYLPLSGGTITGSSDIPLLVKSTTTNSYIKISNNSSAYINIGSWWDGVIGGVASGVSSATGRIVFAEDYGFYYQQGYAKTPYQILHSGNYSQYALPLSGGTMQGSIDVADYNILSGGNPIFAIFNKGKDLYTSSTNLYLQNNVYYFDGSSVHSILHSGNYSSYALPISGGTINGNLTLLNNYAEFIIQSKNNGNTGILFNDSNSVIRWYLTYRGTQENSYLRLYNTTDGSNFNCSMSFNNEDGNIKIGSTTTDSYKFSVNGTLNATTIYQNGTSLANTYLPLTGGTLETSDYHILTLKRDTAYTQAGVSLNFANKNGDICHIYAAENTRCLYRGVVDGYKIWDEGNDGSGSGLDADLLDGLDSTFYFTGHNGTGIDFNSFADGCYINKFYYINTDVNQYNRPFAYGGLLQLNAEVMNAQIGIYNQNSAYLRTRWWSNAGYDWTNWREFAFTDSNVASATKLQTARLIWGQSFDGSGNVDGWFYMNGRIKLHSNDGKELWINYGGSLESGDVRICGYNTIMYYGVGDKNIGLVLNSLGNVGIGTTSPTEKLHVQGAIKSTDGFYTSGALSCHSIELSSPIPYIDFHFNHSSSDYTARIAEYESGVLTLECPQVTTTGRLQVNDNLGVGTAASGYKLDVNGDIRAWHTMAAKSYFIREWNNQQGWSIYNMLNPDYAWFGNNQNYLVDQSSVQVALAWNNGIYTQGYYTRYSIASMRQPYSFGGMILTVGNSDDGTSRGIALELWGNGQAILQGSLLTSGGITMYSDKRKKTILNHVELSLKQVADAPLIEHYYNSDDSKTTHVGSIAQYWASMNDWFCKLDSEGFYTMEIQNCALASAISIARELDRYESKTDKTIKQLKKRICQLEEEVERLRAS